MRLGRARGAWLGKEPGTCMGAFFMLVFRLEATLGGQWPWAACFKISSISHVVKSRHGCGSNYSASRIWAMQLGFNSLLIYSDKTVGLSSSSSEKQHITEYKWPIQTTGESERLSLAASPGPLG